MFQKFYYLLRLVCSCLHYLLVNCGLDIVYVCSLLDLISDNQDVTSFTCSSRGRRFLGKNILVGPQYFVVETVWSTFFLKYLGS